MRAGVLVCPQAWLSICNLVCCLLVTYIQVEQCVCHIWTDFNTRAAIGISFYLIISRSSERLRWATHMKLKAGSHRLSNRTLHIMSKVSSVSQDLLHLLLHIKEMTDHQKCAAAWVKEALITHPCTPASRAKGQRSHRTTDEACVFFLPGWSVLAEVRRRRLRFSSRERALPMAARGWTHTC